jgi:serine/threonine-protein kinase RsbW
MNACHNAYKLAVHTDIYQLSKVQEWFEQFQSQIPRRVWIQSNLVLVEAFTNVVEHAHGHLPESTPIEIELELTDHSLELHIWDYGQPFDMEAEIAKSRAMHEDCVDIQDIPTGGRGLIIAQTIADRLSYVRQPDQRNCFIFYKEFSEPVQAVA